MDVNSSSIINSCVSTAVASPGQTLTKDVFPKLTTDLSLRDLLSMTHVCSQWRKSVKPILDEKILFHAIHYQCSEEMTLLSKDQKDRLACILKRFCPIFLTEPNPVQPQRCWEEFKILLTLSSKDIPASSFPVFSYERIENNQGKEGNPSHIHVSVKLYQEVEKRIFLQRIFY